MTIETMRDAQKVAPAREMKSETMSQASVELPNEPKRLKKSHNHSHFWIQNEQLLESYWTIRGLRWRLLMDVPSMADEEKCSEYSLELIEKEYLN